MPQYVSAPYGRYPTNPPMKQPAPTTGQMVSHGANAIADEIDKFSEGQQKAALLFNEMKEKRLQALDANRKWEAAQNIKQEQLEIAKLAEERASQREERMAQDARDAANRDERRVKTGENREKRLAEPKPKKTPKRPDLGLGPTVEDLVWRVDNGKTDPVTANAEITQRIDALNRQKDLIEKSFKYYEEYYGTEDEPTGNEPWPELDDMVDPVYESKKLEKIDKQLLDLDQARSIIAGASNASPVSTPNQNIPVDGYAKKLRILEEARRTASPEDVKRIDNAITRLRSEGIR